METIRSAINRLHSEMQQGVFNDVNEIGTSKKIKKTQKSKKKSSSFAARKVHEDTSAQK